MERKIKLTPVAAASALLLCVLPSQAQEAASGRSPTNTLATVTVSASADASAQGLAAPYAGGQVARGGRAGILGTRDNMETAFSITSYTNDLIQDKQARSVGEVLQNDPTVRVARGFGNFQESYFIRGFILNSDDVAYNGLFGLLPRQYIATELFERVEVLRGASAFLSGANPGGGGIGGAINLLPKRAPNEPLNRVTVGSGSGGQTTISTDIARRFGPDNATGVRLNAAVRDGGTGIDDEKSRLGLLSLGLDWRSRDVRLSGDIGYQDNRLNRTRPSVGLFGVTTVPAAPKASSNFAQPWTYSNEKDVFGTFRAEWDITPSLTSWAAYGHRSGKEQNSLAVLTVSNGTTGDGSQFRFDNGRKDNINTGELGVRWKARTGSVGHEVVAAASNFSGKTSTSFTWGGFLTTNLYRPSFYAAPTVSALPGVAPTGDTQLRSYALGDTMSFLDDRMLLTLGVRRQQLDITSFGAGYDQGRTSPSVGAVWKASKELSVYANYIEGLTQGETAPATSGGVPVANAGQALAPYVSKQKEAGLKYDAGSFGGGLAVFSTTRPRAFVNSANVFAASGSDRHEGIEVTAFGQPSRGVRVLGGLTWLDARQRSTGSVATDGARVIGVPRTQATLGGEWDMPAVRGLTLDGRVVYTGMRYADAANTLAVPGSTRLDIGARYLIDLKDQIVTLRARLDNATNRNHWASVGGYPGAGYLMVGAPRTLTVSASVDF